MTPADHLRRIRIYLAIVMAGLVLSGVTAFPLESELHWLVGILQLPAVRAIAEPTHLPGWITQVYTALAETNREYPFLAYGTDWLAFAHLVLAVVFIGPYRDPVRNQWVITFGLIACAGVIPLALIAGPIRGIPFAWRCVDCSFAVLGGVPLLLCRRHIRAMQRAGQQEAVKLNEG